MANNENNDDCLQIYYLSDSDDDSDNMTLNSDTSMSCKLEPMDDSEHLNVGDNHSVGGDNGIPDDCDDDNINIIVNDISGNCTEAEQLQHVLHSNNIYSDIYINDVTLQKELSDLIAASIYPANRQLVTVKYNDNLLLLSNTQHITSRMANLFWGVGLQYQPCQLPYLEQFYNSLREGMRRGLKQRPQPPGIDRCETYAIFSVKYRKHTVSVVTQRAGIVQQQQQYQGYGLRKNFKNCNTGLYHYTDFACIIVKDGLIVDYAVHNFTSNINEMLRVHNPVKIIYNANVGDALDIFLRYKYNPFYEFMYDKWWPISINRIVDTFNTLIFCDRNDVFCALCNALKDLRGLLFLHPFQQHRQQQQQQHQYSRKCNEIAPTLTPPRSSPTYCGKICNKMTLTHNNGKNKHLQPTHNQYLRQLRSAPKRLKY